MRWRFSKLRRIDFEAHYYTKEFLKTIADRNDIPIFDTKSEYLYHGGDGIVPVKPIIPLLLDMTEKRIQSMDKTGIDISILSASLGVEQLEPESGAKEAIKLNDALYDAIQMNPSRLRGYAVLAVNNVQASLKELERCRNELGFVGWNAYSNYGDKQLDDKKYFPLLEKAVDLGLFVYLHPAVPCIKQLHGYGPAMATSGLGFSLDVCTALTRMIFNGVFDRLPELKVIIGHLGEGFPFYMRRLNDAAQRVQNVPNKASNKKLPSEYFKTNIWITTSGNFSRDAFLCARSVLDIDHIMFGTDYPMEKMEAGVQFLDSMDISYIELKKIYFENAAKYFGITAESPITVASN
jgi:uncharacterized protein